MSDITNATSLLRQGKLVAFPTETVYGLGADATNSDAVDRIFLAKGRPATNPLIVHVASIDVAKRYATTWPEAAQKLAEAFWPGPLTLVLPKTSTIASNVTAGKETVGLRVPDHPLALELLTAFDGPVAAPSANKSNRVSPTTADHVRAELGDAVNLILDGGPCRVGIESTVLDLSSDVPIILRPGDVTKEQIEQVIRKYVQQVDHLVASHDTAATSPGQQRVHYAPKTTAYRFETSQRKMIEPDGHGMMVVGTIDYVKKWGPIVAMAKLPDVYARHFYEVLRELDEMGLNAIFIEMPPDQPQWTAVRDRITRATRPLGAWYANI